MGRRDDLIFQCCFSITQCTSCRFFFSTEERIEILKYKCAFKCIQGLIVFIALKSVELF